MPVHVTRRRSGVWYAGGTVRAAGQSVTVAERSTGCRARTDADAVAARWDREERDQLIEGTGPRLTVADCFEAYIKRPGGLKRYDVDRIAEMNEIAGHFALTSAATAWNAWVAHRGGGLKPTTIARSRNTFQAALNHGAASHGTVAPRLPTVKGGAGIERAVYLTDDERERLLAAYNPHAGRVALMLAYQGCRSQEALQLDWRNVDLIRGAIHFRAVDTKAERARTVPLHPRVAEMLLTSWHRAGWVERGHVFLSAKGRPYADTRGRAERNQGGNPLAQAHATACARAGVTGFRVHDWRHDFAARMVMSGCDMRTLMDLGGWSSLRMVQRYASVTGQHMVEAIGRLR